MIYLHKHVPTRGTALARGALAPLARPASSRARRDDGIFPAQMFFRVWPCPAQGAGGSVPSLVGAGCPHLSRWGLAETVLSNSSNPGWRGAGAGGKILFFPLFLAEGCSTRRAVGLLPGEGGGKCPEQPGPSLSLDPSTAGSILKLGSMPNSGSILELVPSLILDPYLILDPP